MSSTITPTFIGAVVVAIVFALGKYTTLLDRFKSRSAADAAAELQIADRALTRQAGTIAELRAQKVKLEQEALNPIFEQLHQNAQLQAQVLDRLIHHNGSFAHMEEAMGEIAEGFKLMTGFIAELHGLTVKPPPIRRRTPKKENA